MIADAVPPPFSLERLWLGWSLEPGFVVPILLAGLLYWMGLRRLASPPSWPASRTAAFFGALAVTFLALGSPITAYAKAALSAHLVQHLMLQMVAAPLFLAGAPITLALRASSRPARRRLLLPILHSRIARAVSHPVATWGLFMTTLYATHLTSFYNAAVQSQLLHDVQHALYLGTALLFWWPVVGMDPGPHRIAHPWRIAYLVSSMPAAVPLSLYIAFAGRPVYPYYAALPAPWGPSALSDQHAAGAIMWVFGEIATLVAAAAVAAAWLRHDQARVRRLEARQRTTK